MKTFVQVAKEQYLGGGQDLAFDDLAAQADAGAAGYELLKLHANAYVARDFLKDRCVVQWSDDERNPHRLELPIDVALIRRGTKGEAFLHAQNW